jgi:hypothetical protein
VILRLIWNNKVGMYVVGDPSVHRHYKIIEVSGEEHLIGLEEQQCSRSDCQD